MADIKAIMRGKQNNHYAKYQWPADKLRDEEMAILYNWRSKTKTPINHLLRQAIQELNQIIEGR